MSCRQLLQHACTVSIAAAIWLQAPHVSCYTVIAMLNAWRILPWVSNVSRHQGKIQPNLKDAKFKEQEQRVKYWHGHIEHALTKAGSIVTLVPTQGQGTKPVRQYLEKNSEDPISLFHYFLPKSISKLIIPPTFTCLAIKSRTLS